MEIKTYDILKSQIGKEVIVNYLTNDFDRTKCRTAGILEQVDETSVQIRYGNEESYVESIDFCRVEGGQAIETIITKEGVSIYRNPIVMGWESCPWGLEEKPYSEKLLEAIEIFLEDQGLQLHAESYSFNK